MNFIEKCHFYLYSCVQITGGHKHQDGLAHAMSSYSRKLVLKTMLSFSCHKINAFLKMVTLIITLPLTTIKVQCY